VTDVVTHDDAMLKANDNGTRELRMTSEWADRRSEVLILTGRETQLLVHPNPGRLVSDQNN
jgi:hypothetical protein